MPEKKSRKEGRRGKSPPTASPVAVVGMDCIFPGSTSIAGFWRDIWAGKDLITDVPPSHWLIDDYYDPDPGKPDKTYACRGAFIPPVDFDPMDFGMPPNNIPLTDTAQLLSLVVAKRVLEEATRGRLGELDRDRVSVILGVAVATGLLKEMNSRIQRPIWLNALRRKGVPEDEAQAICDEIADHYSPWKEATFPGLLYNVVAGRIANRFDLGGTNCTVDAACASTLSALSVAVQELQLGLADLVISGGVDCQNDPFMFVSFSKTPALSPTQDTRPFSDKADGMLLGEGIGMFALKRLADAERDGDPVYAVIKGLGSSSDGAGTSIYAPVPEGQAKALRRCYEAAGVSPATVELLEAHGTGTLAGDMAEFKGLSLVFEQAGRKERQWCALGSVKSQMGHAKSSAAAAGFVKAVMALHHKVLPPTIKVDMPDPKLRIEASCFYLNTAARPWIRGSSHPRRSGVSSFGFGGTNYHVALEEYTGSDRLPSRLRTLPTELVLLGADSDAALEALCRKTAESVTQQEGVLVYLAGTTQEAFRPAWSHRLAVVASDETDLKNKLEQASKVLSQQPVSAASFPKGTYYGSGEPAGAASIAFVFPGQGSQYVGMGADLAMYFDEARGVWDRAADLAMDKEAALHEVVFPRPVFTKEAVQEQTDRLTRTEWAQPAIAAASLSMLALLRSLGVRPASVAGHSLGEVTALYEAGVLGAEDVLKVARKRGELMARAAASIPGSMTAVPRSMDAIEPLLASWKSQVIIANHNSPNQVVLSGPTRAVEEVERRLAEEKIRTLRLQVSTAFHSPLMKPTCGPFLRFLKGVPLKTPSLPVYANAEAAPYPGRAERIRALLAKQIVSPVRFVEGIEAMYRAGARVFVEVGPGSVLTRLIYQCLKGRPHTAVNLDTQGENGVTSLWHALGQLAVSGVPVRFTALWRRYARPATDPRDLKRPPLAVSLVSSNHLRPYPPPQGAAGRAQPNPPGAGTASKPADRPARPAPHAWPAAREPRETNGSGTAPVESRANPGSQTPSEPAPLPAPGPGFVPPQETRPGRPVLQPPAGPAGADYDAWIAAYQEIHRKTAEAQAAYEKTMADSHTAFLRSMEAASAALARVISGPLPAPLPSLLPPSSADQESAPAGSPPPVPRPAPPPAAVMPAPASVPAPGVLPCLRSVQESAAVSPAAAASGAQAADWKGLLLSVVAEKTGYPKEILNTGMSLESDLGIDSIKRVEIFSALQERAPWLPELEASDLAQIGTLGDVLAFIEGSAPAAEAAGTAAAVPAGAAVDWKGLLLSVVAEKTGYPKEILNTGMSLEGDLGIDSIKRVEIFSALQERAPWLQELEASDLARIGTLGDVLAFIEGSAPPPEAAAAPAAVTAAAGSAAPAVETPVSSALGGTGPGGDLGRYALRAVVAPHSGFSMKGLTSSTRVAITDDGNGVARALAARLAAQGLTAQVVGEVPTEAGGVIFLAGLRDLPDEDSAVDVNRQAFLAARTAGRRLSTAEGFFVTVQDTGGDFGLTGESADRVYTGGLPGLVKTAALEWPQASVKAIDLERGGRSADALAEELVKELFTGGPENEVGLRADGTRIRLESYARGVRPASAVIDEQSVLVASGGARGVTAATLMELARQWRPRLVLFGRTPLAEEPACCRGVEGDPEIKRALVEEARAQGRTVEPAELGAEARRILAVREIRATLQAIEQAGSPVRYVVADVQDGPAVSAALAEVRRLWGPISGILHGAGVLHDRRIVEKTPAQFDRVFNTKVQGLRTLLAATADDPLRVICLFSSVAARFGNEGQCDYAMANEVLNKVARHEARRRGASCVVKAINWGPWDGGMVSAGLKARFEEAGIPLIPLARGARILVEELQDRGAEGVEVVVGPSPEQGALAAAGAPREMDLPLMVTREAYPYLASHQIKDIPVVPVVLVLEWFTRAGRLFHPGRAVASCHDIKVLRGIQLDRFQGPGNRLWFSCRQGVDGRSLQMALRLPGTGPNPCYTATLQLAETGQREAPGPAPPLPAGMKPWKGSRKKVYQDHLFHGPDFQVIRSLERLSGDAASAVLAGSREMGWPGQGWQTDAAALDGGLQLAILWGIHRLGRPSLPTRIGACYFYRDGPVSGPLRCELQGRPEGKDRTVSDICYLDANGALIARMCGVEMHLLAG